MAMLSEMGGRTMSQGVCNSEQAAGDFDHNADNFGHDGSSFDGHLNPLVLEGSNLNEGDGSDLVNVVNTLAIELEEESQNECGIVASLSDSCRDSVSCEGSNALSLSHKTEFESTSTDLTYPKGTIKENAQEANVCGISYNCKDVKKSLIDVEKSEDPNSMVLSYSHKDGERINSTDVKSGITLMNVNPKSLSVESALVENTRISYSNDVSERINTGNVKPGIAIMDMNPKSLSIESSFVEESGISCKGPSKPFKFSIRTRNEGQVHSHQLSEPLSSCLLASSRAEPFNVKLEAESYSMKLETEKSLDMKLRTSTPPELKGILPPPREISQGTKTDNSLDIKEETAIYVVENGALDNVSLKALISTKSTVMEDEIYGNNDAQAVVHIYDADNDYNPQLSENAQLMLSLSLPLIDVNVAIMEGYVMVKCSNGSLVQVPAKLVYLPNPENLDTTEEVCAMLAPQLLEGGVLFPGNNVLILKNHSFLITVTMGLWEDDKQHTQISISSPVETMEADQVSSTNFVMITGSADQNFATSSQDDSGFVPYANKYPIKNAPNSDEPGVFQCDKCDKSYRVRSSLNSHKVTHNAEKMFKCDECDKAFHYNTPLQIHKRTHSDERPYHCPTCSASFRSKANLKYHERLHTGERPIACQECGQGFKDYTSLKRHKAKAHDLMSIKCDECSQVFNSVENLTSHLWQIHNILYVDKVLYKCEKCNETFSFQKAYNSHMASHRRGEKSSPGYLGKLTDYTYRCGVCSMTCQNKSQMVSHIQVHAAFKRFSCRYCKTAYMYNFMLADHVRKEHPNNPQWFCQHCDLIFKTSRALNAHGCRSIRGNYSCPHCDFKTEIRHRLFRHIVKSHPEDTTPYYCEFCKNSFEDPNKLRYHQKREHPEEMLTLTMQRESSKHTSAQGGDKTDGPSLDMSQIEMTVEGNTFVYHIPQHLRDDQMFQEKVKFKCYYCDSKFPVKHAMTRHILKEHPSEKAYKCLVCNIFFKTTVDSKNHNRKYHRYRETDGRDPQRNEKAMKKRAQWFKKEFEKSDSKVKKAYRFKCRFCPMAYQRKRHLIFHYKKWHPDEEWDYLPDKPFRRVTAKRERKLVYFDCNFNDDCQVVFDDRSMLIEHMINAHGVEIGQADKYIKTRIVSDIVHRGRIPRNAVDMLNTRERRNRTPASQGLENEEDVDDPLCLGEEKPETPHTTLSDLSQNETKEAIIYEKIVPVESTSKKATRLCPKLDEISSMKDVKRLLYRCRKCSLYFSNKAEYKEHGRTYSDVDCRDFLHLNVKQETSNDISDYDDTEYDFSNEFMSETLYATEVVTKNENKAVKVEPFFANEKQSSARLLLGEITVCALEDEYEADTKILIVNESEIMKSDITDKPNYLDLNLKDRKTQVGKRNRAALEYLSRSIKYSVKEAINQVKESEQKSVFQVSAVESELSSQTKTVKVHDSLAPNAGQRVGPIGNNTRRSVSQTSKCSQCNTTFKTRAELGFHVRQDH